MEASAAGPKGASTPAQLRTVKVGLPPEVADWLTEQARLRFRTTGGHVRDLLVQHYRSQHGESTTTVLPK